MINSPCRNCHDRVFACHTVCEKYKQFKVDLEEWKNNVIRNKCLEKDLYMINKIRKK